MPKVKLIARISPGFFIDRLTGRLSTGYEKRKFWNRPVKFIREKNYRKETEFVQDLKNIVYFLGRFLSTWERRPKKKQRRAENLVRKNFKIVNRPVIKFLSISKKKRGLYCKKHLGGNHAFSLHVQDKPKFARLVTSQNVFHLLRKNKTGNWLEKFFNYVLSFWPKLKKFCWPINSAKFSILR